MDMTIVNYSQYPLKKTSEEEARKHAQINSYLNPDWFFHVIWNNTGGYVVDIEGLIHSDEEHVATYHDGEIQLERSHTQKVS